ncbi:hypothetical protein NDI38_29390, partial [Stenomitos frigidus AS-A4]
SGFDPIPAAVRHTFLKEGLSGMGSGKRVLLLAVKLNGLGKGSPLQSSARALALGAPSDCTGFNFALLPQPVSVLLEPLPPQSPLAKQGCVGDINHCQARRRLTLAHDFAGH